jgi:aspartate ammonia-lyase
VVEQLRQITGMGLARAENLIDATQNTDLFVEVSGMLRALASSLLKVSTDLRLLSSGPDAGLGEIQLPPRQAGSSIMPGKVNPVIPEAVGQTALMIFGLDQTLCHACSLGNLELNQYLPLVASCLLESLGLARRACQLFAERCVQGIEAVPRRCAQHVRGATATVTALLHLIGYEAAERVAREAREKHKSIEQVVLEQGLLTPQQYAAAIAPEAVMRLGSPRLSPRADD